MQNNEVTKRNTWLGFYVLVSIVLYLLFAYTLERTQSLKLVLLYAGLFWAFCKLVSLLKHHPKLVVGLAFGFRALFILAIPNLSQDFYRFIWDGRMVLEGFNPYLYTPQSFINQNLFPITQAQELFNGMGSLSAGHFTNYPPLNQLCFILAGLFAGKSIWGSVLVLRLIIIAADFGTLMFGKKLLQALNLPTYNLYWYILNPFIIIELTGNLHFEGVMVFFLVWSLYLLHKHKWQWAAVVFACSVSVKLIPLLFLPLFFKWFTSKPKPVISSAVEKSHSNKSVIASKAKQSLGKESINKWIPASAGMTKLFLFYGIIGLVTILSFLPFYNPQFLNNYTETVGLWFQNFEFNASLYYLFREIGFWISGYNQIAIIGKLLAFTVCSSVIMLGLIRNNTNTKNVVLSMLLALTVYLFLSTTVHPWYLVTLLLLSVFTHYKFPLVWSFMIVLSYLAYSYTDYSENLWIIAFEYVVVFIVFLWDLKKTKPLEN
ncbi:mannosyltransferase [Hanstruepera ponticola]|uniref:mannosyltransferase n=1 Tax=Hanstruepera ponticola TaxID=2042995 RepID=UPI000CF12D29|nr:mannosyltransferase [Hanstruepera ponticola]